MWNSNSGVDVLNDQGQAIQVFVPSLHYGRSIHLSSSTIGGPQVKENASDSLTNKDDNMCSLCQQPLVQVLQFAESSKKGDGNSSTWILQACNSLQCFSSLFGELQQPTSTGDHDKLFSIGGHGVVKCRKIQQPRDQEPSMSKPQATTVKDNNAQNDWLADSQSNDLDDLEQRLASMEATDSVLPKQNNKNEGRSEREKDLVVEKEEGELPWFKLSAMREPPAPRVAHDFDDVGLSTDSNDHIQQMLQKYLEEEEDVDLVNSLRGNGSNGTNNNNNNNGEPDQVLSLAEHAQLQYMDRLKRLPRQVLRFAPGGVPIWSVPDPNLSLPACQHCRGERIFQWQLLPQVLHVLQVDQHVTDEARKNEQEGGMDFGNICFYVCQQCDHDVEGIVVIQKGDHDGSLYSRAVSQQQNYAQPPAVPVAGSDTDNNASSNDKEDEEEGWVPDA